MHDCTSAHKWIQIHKWAANVKQEELHDDAGFDEELTVVQKNWLMSYLQHNHYSYSGCNDDTSSYGAGIDKLSIKVTDSKSNGFFVAKTNQRDQALMIKLINKHKNKNAR